MAGIILRVQSPNGTKRINFKPSEKLTDLFEKVSDAFGLSNSNGWRLFQDRGRSAELHRSRTQTLSAAKLTHGDILFLTVDNSSVGDETGNSGLTKDTDFPRKISDAMLSRGSGSIPKNESAANLASFLAGDSSLEEDQVDQELWRSDGRIERQRDALACKHGPHGRCLHCVPLEPYDANYLKDNDIKFLSFHAFLRQQMGGVDKSERNYPMRAAECWKTKSLKKEGKFVRLENISCRIKPGCTDHAPWPDGICTKCQPSALTLNRQRYRHVDNLVFETGQLVDRLLHFWRATGSQRIGMLYGRYEPHADVPLGIRARVAAIYEPPQSATRDQVQLQWESEDEARVNRVAAWLGLAPLGWIFTDLVALDTGRGTVHHFRHADSHFLSAEECCTAGDLQNRHPNACRLAADGTFGSKFVTVVVSGDKDHQINVFGYQVSNQCMALVRDGCLVPTRDRPELGYIRESSSDQYVPDVFYKKKDEYGNEVTQLARPLPVEYLLVDLPSGFSKASSELATFPALPDSKRPFPAENRAAIGTLQDFTAFASYMSQFGAHELLDALTDFHLLLFMSTCDFLPVDGILERLCAAVRERSTEALNDVLVTEEWQTIQHLIGASQASPPISPSQSAAGGVGRAAAAAAAADATGTTGGAMSATGRADGGAGGGGTVWSCAHCTFENRASQTACEICGLPR